MNLLLLLLCAAAPVALLVVYMVVPRAKLRVLSIQRFIPLRPAGQDSSKGFSFRPPRPSWALFFQLCALLLLLLAALSLLIGWAERGAAGQEGEMLVAIDTSASMATQQDGTDRWSAGVSKLHQELDRLDKKRPVALELVTFDLEVQRRLKVPDVRAARPEVNRVLAELQPTQMGSDALASLSALARPGRTLLVITDQAAPLWAQQQTNGRVIWCDLSRPVLNIGFTELTAARNPLTGAASSVLVEVRGYQLPPGSTPVQLEVTRPDGGKETLPMELTVRPGKDEAIVVVASQSVAVSRQPGRYRLQLRGPGPDAYPLDDVAAFIVEQPRSIDFEVRENEAWAKPLKEPVAPGVPPGMRVVSVDSWPAVEKLRERNDPLPTLAVWRTPPVGPARLAFFTRHDLLREIEFNAFDGGESAVLPPRPPSLNWLEPVLQVEVGGQMRDVALSHPSQPPLVVIPQPPHEELTPQSDEAVVARFLLCANALDFLRKSRPSAPLHTLTAPGRETVSLDEARLALHREEGNTGAHPSGDFRPPENSLGALATKDRQGRELWPWLLVAVAFALAMERSVFSWRGRAWQ